MDKNKKITKRRLLAGFLAGIMLVCAIPVTAETERGDRSAYGEWNFDLGKTNDPSFESDNVAEAEKAGYVATGLTKKEKRPAKLQAVDADSIT